MRTKKRIFLSFSIILFTALFMLVICYVKKDQLAFHRYVKNFTISQLSNNALDLHYTIKSPSDYGITVSQTLPVYQKDEALSSYKLFEEELTELSKIDVTALSEQDAFTYYVLTDYLQENLQLEKYPYYAEPLTPNSGIHTTLPILLAEYAFYTTEDIDNYLLILASVPEYLNSIALYEEEKATAGLYMNSVALDKVVSACEELSTCTDISEHLLYTSFLERLEDFSSETGELSAENLAYYTQKNADILKNDILPAYSLLANKLTDLSPYCNNDYHGLCSYEDGKEYYQAMLKRNTGSYRSVQDIKEMLFADFEESYINLVTLLSENPKLLEADCLDVFDTSFPLSDAKEILNHLQSSMKQDFPILATTTDVEVKTVSKSLQDYCSPAFYLTVPMDAYNENVIYLNEKNALHGLDLYTTLAHESFPGHLYQTVYFHTVNDTSVNNCNPLLRNILYYGGYTEGYALYVEGLSYDYASLLCCEKDVDNAELICDIYKNEWQMQISLYCLLDIAIHYDGATNEQVCALLSQFGIIDEASQKSVYQYLLEEPTTYLKYYLGYLEIENLKNIARGIWGDNYSDMRFHTFLLETGPCSFKRLEYKLLEE